MLDSISILDWLVVTFIVVFTLGMTFFGPSDPRLGPPPSEDACPKCGYRKSVGNCNTGPR